METGLTVKQLRDFELEIFDLFKNKKITSPIHLRGGNEQQLIEVFRNIKPQDYCFTTWASHLECLLKGVPRKEVKKSILNNKSICLSFKKYNIISSAIVGGNAPIATGIAMGNKMRQENRHVWYTGAVQESLRYSEVHDIPITFVVANNYKSVETPTEEIWGNDIKKIAVNSPKCIYYEYENFFPHAGIGEKVLF